MLIAYLKALSGQLVTHLIKIAWCNKNRLSQKSGNTYHYFTSSKGIRGIPKLSQVHVYIEENESELYSNSTLVFSSNGQTVKLLLILYYSRSKSLLREYVPTDEHSKVSTVQSVADCSPRITPFTCFEFHSVCDLPAPTKRNENCLNKRVFRSCVRTNDINGCS